MRIITIFLALISSTSGLAEVNSLADLSITTPKDTTYSITATAGNAVRLYVSAKKTPKYSYSSYAALWIPPHPFDRLCEILFDPPEGSFRVVVTDGHNDLLKLAGRRTYMATERGLFVILSNSNVRIVFGHLQKKASQTVYKNAKLQCTIIQAQTELDSELHRYRAFVVEIVRKQYEELFFRYANVDSFFRDSAKLFLDTFESSPSDVEHFLSKDYAHARGLLVESLGIDPIYSREVYASFLVQYAINLSRFGSSDFFEIGRHGSGTCWQQAVVVKRILRVLEVNSAQLVPTDNLTMGHTTVVTENAVIDPSNNIVIFVSPKEWNVLDVEARAETLMTKAMYGLTLNVNGKSRSPSSFELFFKETGRDMLLENYVDTLELWPFARLAVITDQ